MREVEGMVERGREREREREREEEEERDKVNLKNFPPT